MEGGEERRERGPDEGGRRERLLMEGRERRDGWHNYREEKKGERMDKGKINIEEERSHTWRIRIKAADSYVILVVIQAQLFCICKVVISRGISRGGKVNDVTAQKG